MVLSVARPPPLSADARLTAQALLGVVARMLGPTLEDSAVLYVGGLLRTLLRTLPAAIGPVLGQIVAAVVNRLHVAKVPLLRSTLCLVFACMAHIDARGLLACLEVRD